MRGFLKAAIPLFILALVLALSACNGNGGAGQPTGTASRGAIQTAEQSSGARLSTPELVERLRPSVVHILTRSASFGGLGEPQGGVGTGIIIDKDGYIVTNNHVVVQPNTCNTPAEGITVTLSDGRQFSATIVGRDVFTDLAVIKIDARDLTPAVFAESARLQLGEEVVAMGNALDLPGGPTVTKGVISAKDRLIEEDQCGISIPNAIQTDASINPGNSGGPLVDAQGNVVGITTAVIRGQAEGIGFAISSDTARPIIDQLIQNGRVERAFLGVRAIGNVNRALATSLGLAVEQGVMFQEVLPGTPAANAGLRPGDVIVKIGDRDIRNSGDLFAALARHRAGDNVRVQYYRGRDLRDVTVTLGQAPQ
ncbi:MAG TPA: trypsin-like peptidase domain-containing protein [Dehalococcoidia bacterium]|nr:trypsin-like peptidase domain-containing protein [Dehalococcoidia bacterium]